jgi:hypothetical protein
MFLYRFSGQKTPYWYEKITFHGFAATAHDHIRYNNSCVDFSLELLPGNHSSHIVFQSIRDEFVPQDVLDKFMGNLAQ